MKLLLSILIILSTSQVFAGAMSTVDLIVREAASEDYGYIYHDEWTLGHHTNTEGCLMTVKASVSYYLKGHLNTIEGIYCITYAEESTDLIAVNITVQN